MRLVVRAHELVMDVLPRVSNNRTPPPPPGLLILPSVMHFFVFGLLNL